MIHDIGTAYVYVNERYIFIPEYYPVMQNMTDGQKQNFALTHSLLHMQKSIKRLGEMYYHNPEDGPKLGSLFRDFVSPISSYATHKEAVVKMIINLLKVSEIIGISMEEITALTPSVSVFNLHEAFATFMEELASQCERADHGAQLELKDLKYCAETTWEYTLEIMNLWEALPYLWNAIPDFMKSK